MPTVYDLAYRTLLTLATPALWVRPALRHKLATARRERNGDVPARAGEGPCVLIHAVSVGEVNATRAMVRQLLEADPRLQVVVSVTTETGFARAGQLFRAEPFADRVNVVRYPLDLSSYVRLFLDRLRPDVAVLMELEVWPNFVHECAARGVPVVLVNGRLTEHSYRRYRRARPLVRPMYARLSAVCAQEQTYAERFVALGVPPARVSVTGTMKFDSAEVGERVERDVELARELGLRPRALGGDEPVLVCGSTGPGEEAMLVGVHERLRRDHPQLRLVVVPRKPERFDEVAQLLGSRNPLLRRSQPPAKGGSAASGDVQLGPLVLGDTMGELRKFYSLADVVVVGRTLVDLGEKQHGSDMIEPAALGKPVVVGPYWGNFGEPMRALLSADAVRQVAGPRMLEQLVEVLDAWLRDPPQAAAVGRRARQVVLDHRGATGRHVRVILNHLNRSLESAR